MIITTKDNKFVPEGLEIHLIHGNSSKASKALFHEDLKNPQYTTPDGNPVICIDFETFEIGGGDFKPQGERDVAALAEFWSRKFEAGLIMKKPTKGTFKPPFNFSKTLVASVSICTNDSRSWLINMAHAGDVYPPVFDGTLQRLEWLEEGDDTHTKESQYDLLQKVRATCGRWLGTRLQHVPEGTEFAAHNAWFEYNVSMSCGWDFLWAGQTRHRGGFVCTLLLSRLFDHESHGLKGLVQSYFGFNQPGYLFAILMTHLFPILKGKLTNWNGRTAQLLEAVVKDVTPSSKTFDKDLLEALFDACGGTPPPDELDDSNLPAVIPSSPALNLPAVIPFAQYEKERKKDLAKFKREFNAEMRRVKEKYFSMGANTAPEVLAYAGQDSYWGLRIFKALSGKAEAIQTQSNHCDTLWDYYRKIEHPMIRPTAEMTWRGLAVDKATVYANRKQCLKLQLDLLPAIKRALKADLQKFYPMLFHEKSSWGEANLPAPLPGENELEVLPDPDRQARIDYQKGKAAEYLRKTAEAAFGKWPMEQEFLENEIPDICYDGASLLRWVDDYFDPMGDISVKQALFSVLGLPVLKFTDKGGISLDKSVLPRYAPIKCATLELLSILRGAKHMNGLFFNSFIRLHDPVTDRVHPHYSQSAAATGRYTGSHPNPQQLQGHRPGFLGSLFNVRDQVIAEAGRTLVAIDFSQLELRCVADRSGDRALTACYAGENTVDVHENTRRFLLGALEDLKKGRKVAKTTNFLIIFLGGALALLSNLRAQGIEDFSLEDCKDFIREWYRAYPGVADYNKRVTEDCRAKLYAEDAFGRIRHLRDFLDPDREHSAGRQAVNQTVQGFAGEIMKITLARIYWNQKLRDLDVQLLATIHDEGVWSIPTQNVDEALPLLVDAFNDYKFSVPIRCSVSVGQKFGSLRDLAELPGNLIDWEARLGGPRGPEVDFGDRGWVYGCRVVKPEPSLKELIETQEDFSEEDIPF